MITKKGVAGFTILLALCVIVFGAYVRLTDAGLGCPDWPGCYGFATVPETAEDYLSVEQNFPGEIVEEGKAWREMIHRYIASLLGLLILLLFLKDLFSYRNNKGSPKDLKLSGVLLGLVIFQGLLGMWTVTLKVHPLVVTAHLIGGLTTLSLLFFYYRNLDKRPEKMASAPKAMFVGLVILSAQIILGGWTSTNYAALGCPDLPLCYGEVWPSNMDFDEGFLKWQKVGVNYEGGQLSASGRTAIHYLHRLGAILVLLALGWLSLKYLKHSSQQIQRASKIMLITLLAQLGVGIIMVWFGIPLFLATAHNAFAALLLLSFINLLYTVKLRQI
ncbi:MAG: cytochrome B [Gammaproteobacteria bacterium]|nr:cytochrome B [Gammaproteobacteria bacterium]